MAAAAMDSAVSPADVLPLEPGYLDQGEVVLLAIKPSPWFVFFDSVRWLMLGAMLCVIGALPSVHLTVMSSQAVVQLGAAVIAARLGVAFMRWASRFYVLTNRRVMRLRGVLRPDILACPLVSIRNTRVQRRVHERATGLGTIRFFFENAPDDDVDWREIARCENVHEQVRRAIERALDSQPHL